MNTYYYDVSDHDKILLEQYNQELNKLSEEAELIAEIMQDIKEIAHMQGTQIQETESQTEAAEEAIEEGVEEVQEAKKGTSRTRRFRILTSTGAVAGGALGSTGFLFGPAVGVITMLAGSGIGAGLGGLIHKQL